MYFRYLVNYLKITLVSLLLISSGIVASGQKVKQEAPPLRERMFFGGSFGLQFGTLTNIEISPIAGLWVLPRLAVAAGPTYTYYKFYEDKTTIYGGKFYTQYVLVKDLNNVIPIGLHTGIFLHLEDEFLNLESSFWQASPVSSGRFTVNTVLFGGGISQQLGRRSFVNITALWVLHDSGYDIYSKPEIRLSFNF